MVEYIFIRISAEEQGTGGSAKSWIHADSDHPSVGIDASHGVGAVKSCCAQIFFDCLNDSRVQDRLSECFPWIDVHV